MMTLKPLTKPLPKPARQLIADLEGELAAQAQTQAQALAQADEEKEYIASQLVNALQEVSKRDTTISYLHGQLELAGKDLATEQQRYNAEWQSRQNWIGGTVGGIVSAGLAAVVGVPLLFSALKNTDRQVDRQTASDRQTTYSAPRSENLVTYRGVSQNLEQLEDASLRQVLRQVKKNTDTTNF